MIVMLGDLGWAKWVVFRRRRWVMRNRRKFRLVFFFPWVLLSGWDCGWNVPVEMHVTAVPYHQVERHPGEL